MAIRERRDNGRGRTERTEWKRRPATIAATMLRLLLLLLRTAHLHTCTSEAPVTITIDNWSLQ